MKQPKRVRIVKNELGDEWYDRYIGEEHDVLFYHEGECTLATPSMYENVKEVVWWISELEVLEWEEVNVN